MVISSFQNGGFSLFLSNSLMPLVGGREGEGGNDWVVGLVIVVLVGLGNCLFPVGLRGGFECLSFFFPNKRGRGEEDEEGEGEGGWRGDVEELLRYPRKYYYLLFDRGVTVVLLGVWVVVTFVHVGLFYVGGGLVEEEEEGRLTFLSALVEAVSAKSCGLYSIEVGGLGGGELMVLLLVMYSAALPIILGMKWTEVSSSSAPFCSPSSSFSFFSSPSSSPISSSLSAFPPPAPPSPFSSPSPSPSPSAPSFFSLVTHTIAFDIVFIFIISTLIALIEQPFSSSPSSSSPFSILFEIVSAFGTIGFSIGTDKISDGEEEWMGKGEANASFSANFYWVSKLLVMITFLVGRHRKLPSCWGGDVTFCAPEREEREEEGVEGNNCVG